MYAFLLLCFSLFSHAHQSSQNSSGSDLFWVNKNIPVAIQTNTSDMSSSDVNTIILNSIAQWNTASTTKITGVSSGTNEIRFLSNFTYGSGVIGLTEISYNSSGAIDRASILLNDNYQFKNAPGFYPSGQVFLGDVVTHELGHLLGMSHSEVLNASMFYASYSGQATISYDDKTGVRQKYDTGYGVITGYVKGGNSVGVLGVHVQAISRKTGEASGAISDENGHFRLGGLDLNDTYYLYTSPLKNVSSLPAYYSNSQAEFCPASYLGSFFNKCSRENDGKPQGITLTDNIQEIDVGTVTINCSLKSDLDYDAEKIKSTFSPITIFDYADEQTPEKAFVGWFRKTTASTWSAPDLLNIDLTGFTSLSGNQKYLKVSLVSYPFGSQTEYEMSISRNGSVLATRSISLSSTTQTYSTDFEILVPLSGVASSNFYELSIRGRKLSVAMSAQTFPSFDQFSSSSYLPYLVISSLYELTPQGSVPILDTGAHLSDNQACLDAPFTYAVAKVISSERNSDSSRAQASVAACGTIDPPNDGGPGGPLSLMIAGFLLTILSFNFIKSKKKFLS